ncbi:MAG: type II toxin-antitoxin system prevent-host-death family antitoxin [Acidobacteriota bacterium]
MKAVEMVEASAPLRDYARRVRRDPLIVTEHGKPVAALVGITNADIETASLCTNPACVALIERSRARQEREGGVSPEEMRRRLRLADKRRRR